MLKKKFRLSPDPVKGTVRKTEAGRGGPVNIEVS